MNLFSKKIDILHTTPRHLLLAAFILFLPLLFIGTHTSHDWGDDFAQYIHQAGNIVAGIPQSQTGFVYSQQNYIGPQAYPAGFPMLLAPLYALCGNNMVVFTSFISLLYILAGLLMLIFYRRYFSWITAGILAIIFLYNPQMILFKREVMSDIPFTLLLLLNFILYYRYKDLGWKMLLIPAIFAGIMLCVRPAGITFLAAVMADQLAGLIRRRVSVKVFGMYALYFLLIPILFYWFINNAIFQIPAGGSIRDYLLFYYSGNFLKIIPENFMHHLEVFRYLYIPENGLLKGFSLLLGSLMLAFTAIGFTKRVLYKPEAIDWFFILYSLMLLVFPNNDSAFRLMVPLGFVFLFYAAIGLQTLNLWPQIAGYRKALVSGFLILFLFAPGIYKICISGSNILEGPQRPLVAETFSYIRQHVPSDSIVVFAKPRALALYGGCKSMVDPFTTDPTLFHLHLLKAKARYLLISHKLTGETMKRYVRLMQPRLAKEWENADFVLYRILPVNPAAHL